MSHSVHLKAPPPDAGPFFETAQHTTGRPLAPPHRRVSATANRVPVLDFLRYLVVVRSYVARKARPWLGVRGEAEISGYKTHSRKRLPHQSNSGRGDWFRCQTRKAPPKRGKYILEGKSR